VTLSGSGPVVNDFGGTLSGGGTINPPFTNNGIVNLSGALFLNNATAAVNNGIVAGAGTIIGNFSNAAGGTVDVPSSGLMAINSAWTNSGLVEALGSGGLLTGSTITNPGTIEGVGQINSPITNSTGVVRASSGELILGGAGNTNGTSAQIQATTGGTVFFSQGLATNSGTIALTGGAFDNNNHAISNASGAYINGQGVFRSGGLTNNGFMNIGGSFGVFGPVINPVNGSINATGAGLNAFYGSVTNSGSIGVSPGASVTFFNSFSGTNPVNNSGTVTFNAISSSGPLSGCGLLNVGSTGVSASLQLVNSGGISRQSAISIASGSELDITNNALVLQYSGASPEATIEQYIETGAIVSSYAASNGLLVAYADGGDGIVTGLPAGQLLIEPALAGDTDLNGTVNIHDLQNLLSDFNAPGF
jgi:fibronectin-binding autotransporter adhesin